MATIIAWFVKFFSGFAVWKSDKLGKVLWVIIICGLVIFGFWKIFLEKKIANSQHTDISRSNVTYTYYYQDCSNKTKDDTFSLLKLWRLRLLSVR